MKRVVIIADDLTGALDAAVPFAARGLPTIALMIADGDHRHIPEEFQVIAVATGSRELPPHTAEARVRAALDIIAGCDALFFKKIDSRLKGNASVETATMMRTLGFERALVAPAIPDLGRYVQNGCVVGAGVDSPIPVADAFGPLEQSNVAPSTTTEEELGRAAAKAIQEGALLVGARGLAKAAAGLLPDRGILPVQFDDERPLTFVIGSRDPVTLRQVKYLRQRKPDIGVELAPNGNFKEPAKAARKDRILLLTQGPYDEAHGIVARRFAEGVIARLGKCRNVIVTGGETAQAILLGLGISTLKVQAELLPGVVWSSAELSGTGQLNLVTKSGGFGATPALWNLYVMMRAR